MDLIHFYVIWQIKHMATFVSQDLAGSRKSVHSVFIWEQDSALKWLCFRVISCGINEGLALKCSLLPLSTLFHGIYYGNIDDFAD